MSAIIRKTPRDPMLDLLYNLERRMGRIFNEPVVFSDWSLPELASTAWVPVVDIFEEPEHIRIVAEIPGVKPENFKISVEDNVLTISGTKEQVAEEKAEKVHRYERTYGSFERSFTLPDDVDPKLIRAEAKDGVLTLTLPKSATAKTKPVAITVQ